MSRYSKSMSDTMAEVRANEEKLLEVSPPGFKGTVKAMKKHDEIDNPYALAWHMKNKGDEAHYKDKDGRPEKKEKFKEEVEIDEAKKGLRYKGAPAELRARQLVDTSKETLIVKRNRVIVIDKEDEESYLKKGWQLAETFEAVDIDTLHAEALQENESLQEAEWKVQLKGLPVFYVPAKSAGEVRAMLRKQIKKPDDIISVEKASKAEKKKDFRGRVQEK